MLDLAQCLRKCYKTLHFARSGSRATDGSVGIASQKIGSLCIFDTVWQRKYAVIARLNEL